MKAILTGRRDELERIAEALIEKETLDRGELDRLLAQSSKSTEVESLFPKGAGLKERIRQMLPESTK